MSAFDLQDAYFHVSIHPAHGCFLRFAIGDHHCRYNVLPSGISTALRIFMKTMIVVVAHLHTQAAMLFHYIND